MFYELLPFEALQSLTIHYADADQELSQGLFYVTAAIPLLITGLVMLRKVKLQLK